VHYFGILVFLVILYNLWRHLWPGKSIVGKRVLITGGGMGIGRLMALKFAQDGAKIVLWDIRKEGITAVAKEITDAGGEVNTFVCDVANSDMVYEVASRVLKEVGDIDILVNNAGIVGGKPFLETSDEILQRTMEVNCLSQFWMWKAFLPHMLQKNSGHIVTIASVMGYIGSARLSEYCASKHAVMGFESSMRLELARLGASGIYTTVVCPYAIQTGMFQGIQTKLNWIFPQLEPSYVANQVVKAVRQRRLMLILPTLTGLVLPVMKMVPVALFDWTAVLLGGTDAMDKFQGRGENFSLLKLDKKKQ